MTRFLPAQKSNMNENEGHCSNDSKRPFFFQSLHCRGKFRDAGHDSSFNWKVQSGQMLPSHFLKIDTAIHDLHVPVHPLIPHCDKCTGRTSSNLSASRNQVGVKSSLDGWSDGLLWLATLANQGEKRHLYSKLIYSATKAVPKEVEAFARMNADLPASLSK